MAPPHSRIAKVTPTVFAPSKARHGSQHPTCRRPGEHGQEQTEAPDFPQDHPCHRCDHQRRHEGHCAYQHIVQRRGVEEDRRLCVYTGFAAVAHIRQRHALQTDRLATAVAAQERLHRGWLVQYVVGSAAATAPVVSIYTAHSPFDFFHNPVDFPPQSQTKKHRHAPALLAAPGLAAGAGGKPKGAGYAMLSSIARRRRRSQFGTRRA